MRPQLWLLTGEPGSSNVIVQLGDQGVLVVDTGTKEMSQKLLGRKIDNIEKTGAAVVASANPGCSVQLQAGLRQANKAWRIVHPISLLAEAACSSAALQRARFNVSL